MWEVSVHFDYFCVCVFVCLWNWEKVSKSYSADFQNLIKTLYDLSDPNTRILLAYEKRDPGDVEFFRMLSKNFKYTKVTLEQGITQILVCDSVCVFEWKTTVNKLFESCRYLIQSWILSGALMILEFLKFANCLEEHLNSLLKTVTKNMNFLTKVKPMWTRIEFGNFNFWKYKI